MKATRQVQEALERYYQKARICDVPRLVAERILAAELSAAAKLPNRTTMEALDRASRRITELGQ